MLTARERRAIEEWLTGNGPHLLPIGRVYSNAKGVLLGTGAETLVIEPCGLSGWRELDFDRAVSAHVCWVLGIDTHIDDLPVSPSDNYTSGDGMSCVLIATPMMLHAWRASPTTVVKDLR